MTDTCKGCGKPVLDGQARYTAGEGRGEFWHWDCKQRLDPPRDLRAEVNEADAKFTAALARLRRALNQ